MSLSPSRPLSEHELAYAQGRLARLCDQVDYLIDLHKCGNDNRYGVETGRYASSQGDLFYDGKLVFGQYVASRGSSDRSGQEDGSE